VKDDHYDHIKGRCGPELSRRLRLPDVHDILHMKVVRSSASRTDRLYPQETFLVLIFTRGWVDLRAMVRSEGNVSLKNPLTPPGIDPGTVQLVAQRLNHYATPGPIMKILRIHNHQTSRCYDHDNIFLILALFSVIIPPGNIPGTHFH